MVMTDASKPEIRRATDDVRAKALADLETAALAFSAYMTHGGIVTKSDPVAIKLMSATKRWQIVRDFGENPDDAEAQHRWQQDTARTIRRQTRVGD